MEYLSTNEKLLMINVLYDYWCEYGFTKDDVLEQLIKKIAENENFILPDGEYHFIERGDT